MNNKFGLIGHNISYSRSPLIHKLIRNKENISYDLIDIENINNLNVQKLNEFNGINITIPYKKEIFNWLETNNVQYEPVDYISWQMNISNTIKLRNNKAYLYNTDIMALDYFVNKNKFKKKGIQNIVILGSGQTAQMCLFYFKNYYDNINNVYICSRKVNNNTIKYNDLPNVEYDLIINTTPIGQGKYKNQEIIAKNIIQKAKIIIDYNYNPNNNLLILRSKYLNKEVYNGLELLIIQALFSQKIWTKDIWNYWENKNIDIDEINQNINRIKNEIYKKNNKFIVYGMPCSGKTKLYNKLKINNKNDYTLFDLDEEIEKKTKCSINEIINQKGIKKFRDIEKEVFNKIIDKSNNLNEYNKIIVFVGGGFINNENNKFIIQDFILIYLKTELQTLIQRLTKEEINKRPLINDLNDLKTIYYDRQSKYNNIADIIIDNNK